MQESKYFSVNDSEQRSPWILVILVIDFSFPLTSGIVVCWLILALQSCCSPFTVAIPSLFDLQYHSGRQLSFSELTHKLLASGKYSNDSHNTVYEITNRIQKVLSVSSNSNQITRVFLSPEIAFNLSHEVTD